MSLTTTIKNHKITIGGSGSLIAVLALLMTLNIYGVSMTTSGDIQCAGNDLEPCISFINISTTDYAIVFPKATLYFDNEKKVNFTLYKLDTIGRWQKFNISGKTIPANAIWQLKLVGYKGINETVKWGMDQGIVGVDPVWSGYSATNFFVNLVDNQASVGGGYAIFDVRNPTSFNLTFNTSLLNAVFTKHKGNDIKSWSISIAKNVTNPQNITDFATICSDLISLNGTVTGRDCQNFPIGWHWQNISLVYQPLTTLTILPHQTARVNLSATWDHNVGFQQIEWFPQASISGVSFINYNWQLWNSPLAYYHFDENTGTYTADSSGNDHPGYFNGTGNTWVASPNATFNYAINFTGSGGVNVSTGVLTGDWSFSVWIKIQSCPSSYRRILGNGVTDWFDIACQLNRYHYYDGSWKDSGITISTGWTNFVFTRDSIGGKVRFFENGTYKGVSTGGRDLKIWHEIGNYFNLGANGWVGKLDDVAFYNSNLTDADISALYTGSPFTLTSPPSGVLIYANRSSNPAAYDGSTFSVYNISYKNLSAPINRGIIEINSAANYTMNQIKQNATHTDFGFNTILTANFGNSQSFRMCGNDTSGLMNCTAPVNFTINGGALSLSILHNVTSPITNPTASNITGTGCSFNSGFGTDVTCTLYRGNSTYTATGNNAQDNALLGVGYYAYNYSSTKGANYSASSATNYTLSVTLLLNCLNLDYAGGTYTMGADIVNSINTTCMNITANNVTLDCQNHLIDGIGTSPSYGINVRRSSITNTNATIKNCNLADWFYGTYLYYSGNNNMTNNLFNYHNIYGIYIEGYGGGSNNNILIKNTANLNEEGFYIESDNNYLANNTATACYNGISFFTGKNNILINNTVDDSENYGIDIRSSSNNNTLSNNIFSNSVINFYLYYSSNNTMINGSTSDYYLVGAGITNNFTNTNFTASRTIYFDDILSWFNFRNDSSTNIWLKNNISAAKTITRTLNNFTQTNMSWNESINSGTVLASYNITGLLPSTYYAVYNGTEYSFVYKLVTDGSGNLPNFVLNVSTVSRTVQVATYNASLSVGMPKYTVNLTDDTEANANYPTTNFGTQTTNYINGPTTTWAEIQFWAKANITSIPIGVDLGQFNFYHSQVYVYNALRGGCSVLWPCEVGLYYSPNATWTEGTLTWNNKPSIFNVVINRQNITTNTSSETFNITELMQSAVRNITLVLKIRRLNFNSSFDVNPSVNITTRQNATKYPTVVGMYTQEILNQSSCTPLNSYCYQNGTFTPNGQTTSQWLFNVTNDCIGVCTPENITANLNITLSSCVNHFITNNSAYIGSQTVNASIFNVSTTTAQTIVANLAVNSSKTYWSYWIEMNCTAGMNLNGLIVWTAS